MLHIVPHPWTEIDWAAPRPGARELRRSRDAVQFIPASVGSPAVLRVVDQFRSMLANGGALAAAFTVQDADDTAQWFLSRNRFEEYGFIRCLLTAPALAETLPELYANGPLADSLDFRDASALGLDGSIASVLTWGGAYVQFVGSGADAKRMGQDFSDEIIGDRYDEFRLHISGVPWCPWFFDIAWDHTWIITDLRDQRVLLLCITDTD